MYSFILFELNLNLNCTMQLKQFYNIATKVSSRKKSTTFGDLPDWSIDIHSYTLNIRHVFQKFRLELRPQIRLHNWKWPIRYYDGEVLRKSRVERHLPVLVLHQASHVFWKPHVHLSQPGSGVGEAMRTLALPSAVHPQLQQPRSTPTCQTTFSNTVNL